MKITSIIILLCCAMACAGVQANQEKMKIKQHIAVSMQVPDAGWRIRILEIHNVNRKLFVISEVYRHTGMASQVISTVEDTVAVTAPTLPITHFVIGKTWDWSGNKSYHYIGSKEEIMEKLMAGECLFKKER